MRVALSELNSKRKAPNTKNLVGSQYVFRNWFQVCVAVVFVFFTDGRGSSLGLNVNRLSAPSVFQLCFNFLHYMVRNR